ncbi:MAG: MFS transporter [Bacteroidia bacterium]|nr:MFS transporter [Bacteroidia bacterium]
MTFPTVLSGSQPKDQTIQVTHWLLLGLSTVVYLLGGTAATLISVYLPGVVADLLGDNTPERLNQYGPYLNAAFLYGMTAGGLTLGILSDRIGRVRSLAVSAAGYGLFTCLMVSVSSWQMLVLYRFMAGMGVAGVLLISTVFISEVWPVRSRAVVQGLLSLMFPVGIVLTGVLNVQIADWRLAAWLGLVPILAAGLMPLLLRESDVWRQSRTAPPADSGSLFSADNRRQLLFGAVIYGSVLIGLWAVFSWTPTWVNGLPGTGGQQVQGFTMMIFGLGGIAGGAVSGLLVNRLGLRRVLLMTFGACFCLCCLLFLTHPVFSPRIYVETALLALLFGISQGALSVYVPQLFPSLIRATATGFCFNIGRVFTASAVFFAGWLATALGGFGNAICIFSVFFVVAAITVSRDSHL